MSDNPATIKTPIRPLQAWRALRKLIADPDATEEVFVIIDALSGNNGERLFERFRATEVGHSVLAEKRDILATLSDLEALRSLPEGSLGHTYAAFMTSEQLSADGLVEASQWDGDDENDEEESRLRFGSRLRDTHDLWHCVTGYNRDLVGESALLAFTYAQTRNRGIGLIVAMAWLMSRGEEAHGRVMIRDAYRRGRDAGWLPAADWEALLERPLDEVRAALGVGEPPDYVQVRSEAGANALAAQAH